MPDLDGRLHQLEEFCERHDWELHVSRATQREPTHLIAITIGEAPAVTLKAESADSVMIAVAKVELALTAFGRARSDAYLCDPHRDMGKL